MTDPAQPLTPDQLVAIQAIVNKPAVPAAASGVSPGWKSTELYLAVALLAGLGYAVQQLVEILPKLASNPALPPWVSMVIPIAVTGLGFVAKLIVSEYATLRTQLKLGAGTDPVVSGAQAAGGQAAGLDPAAALALVNK